MLEINKVWNMDCIEGMKLLPDNSVDSIVTDPPYGLSFMGKKWDYDVPTQAIREECLRVLKPGGYLLAFAGTRTQHRMAVRIEDAGFEIRDMIAWVYGSGFPKSLNVGKSINSIETKEWSNIGKALDIVSEKDILQVWKNNSSNVSIVETQSLKNQIIAGQDMPREISVQANVAEENNQENGNLIVDFVVKNLQEAQVLLPETNTVLMNVDAEIKQKQDLAKFVEQSLQNLNHKYLNTSIAEGNVNELQKEKTSEIIKVEEALMILRGNKKYGEDEVINVLCVALTENLKLTILNQSKTFQSLDTKSQIECVSAINVTITEYTAECLISSTVDIAKKIAVDKLQGNERIGTGEIKHHAQKGVVVAEERGAIGGGAFGQAKDEEITKGTSEREGRGTSLKPALEPITVARKPLGEKTVAENCLKWGVGGINIDGCRVEAQKGDKFGGGGLNSPVNGFMGNTENTYKKGTGFRDDTHIGRFPANFIHDGSDEVVDLFPETKTNSSTHTPSNSNPRIEERGYRNQKASSGSASRFFYVAKASKSDRNEGCEDLEPTRHADRNVDDGVGGDNPRNRTNTLKQNYHPTVKPTDLMRYLTRLVTRKGGLVLDPFTGSGSTGKACKLEGFDFIGFELDEGYCDIANKRLQTTQVGLF